MLADQGALFNPQQQFTVTWPSNDPAISLAYVDQLERSSSLSAAQVDLLREVIETATAALEADRRDAATKSELRALADTLDESTALAPIEERRIIALRTSLQALSERL